jgi:hypothetical protein
MNRRVARSVALLREVNDQMRDVGKHGADALSTVLINRARARLEQWDADARRKTNPRQLTIFDHLAKGTR